VLIPKLQTTVKTFFSAIGENHIKTYPTPLNFSYFWGFGSLSGLFLAIQLVTGIFLAMYYAPHTLFAFISIEHIMRDINNGWLLRYLHANGASFFFIMVYIHIGRGLYFSSYNPPHQNLWRIGLMIFIIMMAIAFMGYVLPWGQMSFWGATVITNLFTAIPLIGQSVAYWLWGGYSVDNATLNRFFSLHYLLPFVLVGLVFLHLILLHISGSTNPLKIRKLNDFTFFYPYYYHKDLFLFLAVLGIFFVFVFFSPNLLGHPDNYVLANPLITPTHIVPEWYFLPYYAISRSIPNKIGGVVCMFGALVILFFLPKLEMIFLKKRVDFFNFYFRVMLVGQMFRTFNFWLFFYFFIILGWLGAQPVEYPYIVSGFLATLFYFSFFIIIIPALRNLQSKNVALIFPV
jgi:ubiquinol-cytochrome c reductase cytochrome b subunit